MDSKHDGARFASRRSRHPGDAHDIRRERPRTSQRGVDRARAGDDGRILARVATFTRRGRGKEMCVPLRHPDRGVRGRVQGTRARRSFRCATTKTNRRFPRACRAQVELALDVLIDFVRLITARITRDARAIERAAHILCALTTCGLFESHARLAGADVARDALQALRRAASSATVHRAIERWDACCA